MELTFSALGVLSGFELLLWWSPVWHLRKPLAAVLLVILSFATGLLLAQHLSSWVVLISVFSVYRVINLLRLVQSRIQPDYLYFASRQTALWLISAQIFIVLIAQAGNYIYIDSSDWLYVLAGLQLAGSLIILSYGLKQLKATQPVVSEEGLADRELPALTVAIPARNETTDLEACLQTLVASTYPKLEILVLDDCSQNKHTPEIIRSFAHDGVRFIAGKVPPSQWLAKNYAYAQLADEANSELLLFCGVDVRFEPHSLQAIVKNSLQTKQNMISILPCNVRSGGGKLRALLVQPSRYFWELSMPRQPLLRPPVLSTCWLITRKALKLAGGFEAVTHKAVPESYLARQTAANGESYSFIQSSETFGVSSHKSFQEQRDTAVRTRYPQLHRRIELVALIGMLEFGVLVWPFILLATAILGRAWPLAIMAALTCVTNTALYFKIVNLTYRTRNLRGLWFLPIAALYDIGLLNYSMWQYEFDEVIWKGRNICIPIMRVIPHFPNVINESETSQGRGEIS